MKLSEFRKLIREEIGKVLKEATTKFKIGQTVNDINGDESFKIVKVYPNLQAALTDLKNTQSPSKFKEITSDVQELYSNYRPISKSDNNKPWYILEPEEGGFNDVPYLNPETYISLANNSNQATSSTPVKLRPNTVYMVFVSSQGVGAPMEASAKTTEALAGEFKSDGDTVKKLDKDTYVKLDRNSFTVFGKPTSPKYAEFWQLVGQGGNARQKALTVANAMVKQV